MSAKKAKFKKPAVEIPEPRALESSTAIRSSDAKTYFYVGAALSFVVSLIFYLRTMAVSASFWDSGEFIAAAHTLGVPHSPGTPLYVLVGRVFTLLPLPLSVAQKVNLLSVVCGALGVLFLYILVVKFLDHISGKIGSKTDSLIKVVAGLTGAFFIAFSSTYWINAIEAEVYAMSCFLMGFMTWLGLKWGENPTGPKGRTIIYLLFYLLAMSVGFHLGTILAFSGIFFFVWLTQKKPFSNLEFLIACAGVGIFVADATLYRNGQVTLVLLAILVGFLVYLYYAKSPFAVACAALFLLGLSVHLYLFIRSAQNPTIDMGDPEQWRAFYWVLRREQYPPINIFVRKASFIFQLNHFNDYYQSQFQMFSASLGKLSLGSILPIALGIWGMVDHFSKSKKSFIMLFVTFLVTSLGLIVFLNFSDDEVRERDYFYSPAFYYFAVFIGIGAAGLLSELKNALKKRGGMTVPILCISGAVLLALPFFTAKHHFFSHDRSDNYSCRDFAMNVLTGLKQNAIVFTHGDNDTYPLWYIQEVEKFRKDVRVVNLSLLNTPWYIKQLRDVEPKVPIGWTDQDVDSLHPIATKDGVLHVRDLALRQIIYKNNWRQPIYIAVTTPRDVYAPLDDYLEYQGLVLQLVKTKGTNQVDEELLEDNLMRKFSFRSILTDDWKNDRSVNLPPHTRYLITNYALAFVRLAYIQQDEPQKAVKSFEIAREIAPDYDAVVQLLGKFYFMAGDTQRALQHYNDMMRKYPDRLGILFNAAEIYERVGDIGKAISLLDRLVQADPNHRDAALTAFGLSLRANLLERARGYLVKWLNAHPNDEEMLERLKKFDEAVQQIPKSTQGIGK
ncbi:MAG: DUF2723 domain-containing protein [Candidatus Latescibacteria bacterium]|nr:DUF2723 domain-containing protein [Candidatus Latescibacterota bacterium]NIO29002.1 DUF2723 domain-containing protein [Candidatus Latescibacterota bacterium]NIO56627.1 DUF2723 domain-containing protein [Candidatus Latescibacterota bacterium]NIT02211.1 DUF2723 domain-containing protein [Candidatus Latescibacterota bacterium]NIT39096.1 DUF2723 domain-containing protein [Candidatus Latescibacterota bacterium]